MNQTTMIIRMRCLAGCSKPSSNIISHVRPNFRLPQPAHRRMRSSCYTRLLVAASQSEGEMRISHLRSIEHPPIAANLPVWSPQAPPQCELLRETS